MFKLVITVFIISSSAFAVLDDNFSKAGYLIQGQGYFSMPFPEKDDNKEHSLDISGTFGLFIKDRIAPLITVGYTHYYSYRHNYDPSLNSHDYGIRFIQVPYFDLGVNWFWGFSKKATNGFVHSLGLNLRNSLERHTYAHKHHPDSVYSGSYILNYYLKASPDYTLYYFITERIAPHISLDFPFNALAVSYRDNTWSRILNNELHGDLRISIGFTYFLPTSDRVLIKK